MAEPIVIRVNQRPVKLEPGTLLATAMAMAAKRSSASP